jgi:hypothetical protein
MSAILRHSQELTFAATTAGKSCRAVAKDIGIRNYSSRLVRPLLNAARRITCRAEYKGIVAIAFSRCCLSMSVPCWTWEQRVAMVYHVQIATGCG